jgi:nucleoid DNA-binding protein
MNQSELIEKVGQATELNQTAAGHAVKAVVNAILDALVAGDAVRVSGLGTFNVAARPASRPANSTPPTTAPTKPSNRSSIYSPPDLSAAIVELFLSTILPRRI